MLSLWVPAWLGLDNGAGLRPPMGYCSWNDCASEVTELRIRRVTRALIETGLAAKGYVNVNVDEVRAHHGLSLSCAGIRRPTSRACSTRARNISRGIALALRTRVIPRLRWDSIVHAADMPDILMWQLSLRPLRLACAAGLACRPPPFLTGYVGESLEVPVGNASPRRVDPRAVRPWPR